MPIAVRPLAGVIGAEVTDVDLTRPLSYPVVVEIERALLEHLVLVFPDQPVSEAQHIDFARQFGEIQPPPLKTRHHADPELHVLDQTSPRGEGADNWHADHTYTPEPAMGSILRAVTIPRVGGDTMFASMYAAWEALSGPMQRMLLELEAEHDVSKSARRGIRAGHLKADLAEIQRRLPPVRHPVVRTHPLTGRKALFVNVNSTVRILDVPEAESDAILRFLFEHVKSPDFQMRVRWAPDTIVFLDNRCTQHYAVPDYDERRVLHRVTIKGDRPFLAYDPV
ncbi:MAG: TauD/TfdA family dioxygenase [Myxococcota bacterium]|nr:TauD/TfdA family dioxygenase [Myxococcales bacterium]